MSTSSSVSLPAISSPCFLHVAIIRAGVLQAVGTPAELRARYAAAPETSLEDLFLRVTDEPSKSR